MYHDYQACSSLITLIYVLQKNKRLTYRHIISSNFNVNVTEF